MRSLDFMYLTFAILVGCIIFTKVIDYLIDKKQKCRKDNKNNINSVMEVKE